MSEHTPGPWYAHETYRNVGSIADVWITTDKDRLQRGNALAKVFTPIREIDYTDAAVIERENAEKRANAQLFIDAPNLKALNAELVAALQRAVADAKDVHEASARAADLHNNSDACAGGNYMAIAPLPDWYDDACAALKAAEEKS